jgi:hypothetical protein
MINLMLTKAKLLDFTFLISKGLDGLSLRANKKSEGQEKNSEVWGLLFSLFFTSFFLALVQCLSFESVSF